MNSKLNENLFTPCNISVSSKHVLAIFDDGHSMIFIVAPFVKGFYSPAVRGGAVAQQPLRTISYSRRQKMWQVAEKVYVARQYCRVDWHA